MVAGRVATATAPQDFAFLIWPVAKHRKRHLRPRNGKRKAAVTRPNPGGGRRPCPDRNRRAR